MKRGIIKLIVAVGLFLTLTSAAMAQETISVTFQGPFLIPDNPANVEVIFPVVVTRALNITKVTVTLDIDHPRIGDLRIKLVNPTGRSRTMADKNCGGTRNLTNFTFETSAPQRFGDTCPTGAGQTLAPREEIDTWGGDTSLGLWDVRIEDDEDGNIGFLNNYTIRITGTRVTAPAFNASTILDSASARRGPLSPGELVWIGGAALGPTDVVSATFDSQGRLPTELGGASVSFDGIAAPIIVAAANALQVQVPNELAGRSSTSIQVRFQGAASAPVATGVVAASPGLYALGGTGSGQLNAQNADFSRNSPTNAAARGSYVIVYANGLGVTTPAVPTGQRVPPSPLSIASFPITASIGGQPAQVLYAGLAPGLVGVFQLNITVPQNASTGAQVPLTITINGVPSQDGVSIAVR